MKIKISVPILVLKEEKTDNIRKSNVQNLYLLTNAKNNIFELEYNGESEIKLFIREQIKTKIVTLKNLHLEQVYTLCEPYYYKDDCINIIYLGLTNFENILEIKNNKLLKLDIKSNKCVTIEDACIEYKTIINVADKNIEYIHKIKTKNKQLEKEIVMLLTAYKHLKSRVGDSDIIFKLMPYKFTLEDVRNIYEVITESKVDKSNFRKKIIKYCKKIDEVSKDKGYRPTQLYSFELNLKDVWI